MNFNISLLFWFFIFLCLDSIGLAQFPNQQFPQFPQFPQYPSFSQLTSFPQTPVQPFPFQPQPFQFPQYQQQQPQFQQSQFQPQSFTTQQCVTPDQKAGRCVDLRQCTALFQLVQNPHISSAQMMFLRQSQCAYFNNFPWVCCSSDQTHSPIQQQSAQQPTQTSIRLKYNDLPAPGVCGFSVKDRIVGGNVTLLNEFPWMALIEYTKPAESNGFHCGGALINKDYVLTASHCVNAKSLVRRKWRVSGVRLGEWDQSTDPDCDEGNCADPAIDVPVIEQISHENFHDNEKDNDIALLRLARSVTFSTWIKPICLPITERAQNLNYIGYNFVVSASKSDVKLKVELKGAAWEQCSNLYRSHRVILTQNQICAGGERDKDSCQGDSGGPLMAVDDSDRLVPYRYYYIVGIVSFGLDCGQQGWPGVYTKVDRYIDWILSHMRQ